MRAILIDVQNKEIKEVEQNGLQDMYRHIGCDCVTVVEIDSNNDVFVDDEGLLKGNKKAFKLVNYAQPLMGNGLICGLNPNTGDTVDITLTVDQIKNMVIFVDFDNVPEIPPFQMIGFP